MTCTWADMGRAIGATDQRMNNWKARGSVSKAMEAKVAAYLDRSVDWLKTGNPSTGKQNDDLPTNTLETIKNLQGLASPRSLRTLSKLQAAAEAGRLTDEDWILLERIAERFEKQY